MSIEVALDAGRAAWHRLRGDRKLWTDWLAVARALQIGRTNAMKIAKTNRAVGSRYNAAMGQWLKTNGLDGITAQERYRLGLILDNLTAIGTWRSGLTDEKRRRLNHPNAIWAHWRRSIKPPAPQRITVEDTSTERLPDRVIQAARTGRPVYWSQAALRRAHQGMLDCRSNDLLTLARVALQAAIRSEGDLLELLTGDHAVPRRSTEPAHAA